MSIPEKIREIALSFPETDEHQHHDIRAFRVKKKIFATLNVPEQRATLKFSADMQDIFSRIGKDAIFPVPNAWGKYGWTTVLYERIPEELLRDALLIAWRDTAPPAFQKKYPDRYLDD